MSITSQTLAALIAASAPTDDARPPQGTVGAGSPATAGETNLEGLDTFGTATDPAATEEDEEDVTNLQLTAGGIVSTGNARAAQVTGSGTFRLRRGIHQFSAQLAGNYAQASTDPDEELEPTVGNVQGRVRYDVYFAKRWSAFGMVTARHDPFQGLDLRLNVDPGVAFYVLTSDKHRLWFEAGYDYQFDVRTDEGREVVEEFTDEATGETTEVVVDVLDPTRHTHAARLFGGYRNALNEHVTFDTGLEYLQSFLQAKRWRINWDVSLTAQLAERFALATTFTLRVDNDPLPGVEKVDTITAVNLVVSLI